MMDRRSRGRSHELLVRERRASLGSRSVAQIWSAKGREEGVARDEAASLATLPMISASSRGFDHIGQWLVGRSIQVTLRSSGMPARNAHRAARWRRSGIAPR